MDMFGIITITPNYKDWFCKFLNGEELWKFQNKA